MRVFDGINGNLLASSSRSMVSPGENLAAGDVNNDSRSDRLLARQLVVAREGVRLHQDLAHEFLRLQ